MHRWIPQVPPHHLGYVPTTNPYVTFPSRGLERSQDPNLPEERLRKNRNNRARDSKVYMYNHVLPHVQPRTTHPPSCIRGGSRAPSPPENKKIIKPTVFKLHSPKPTFLVMYYPTSIPQKIPPLRHPGVDLGGVLPLCQKYLLEPYAIRFQTQNTTCISMYSHVQPLFYPM